jgi:hypothetical protein
MSTAVAGYLRPIPLPKPEALRRDPVAQAFLLLRIAFTVAPILFGLDKFAEVLTETGPSTSPVSSTTSCPARPRTPCISSG